MKALNECLDNVLTNIGYAHACAAWLQDHSEGDCREVALRLSRALVQADVDLSRFITDGVSSAKDDGRDEALGQINAIEKGIDKR